MFGSAYDRVTGIACIARICYVRQFDDTHAEHNPYVLYVKRVVVCRTVQLRSLLPHLGLLWLVSCSKEMDKTEVEQLLTWERGEVS